MAEVYTGFNNEEDVVTEVQQTLSSGMFSGGVGTLSTFFTSSAQSSSNGKYFYDVYKTSPATDSEAEVQFSIAFGHYDGSGSIGVLGSSYTDRPSAAVYSQFRNLLLAPNDDKFTFTPSKDRKHIYVISMARARMREKMDPGNWELHLSGSAAKKISLIDDSGATTNPTVNQGGRVFNVVSGTIASGDAVTNTAAASETTDGAYGLFYPDMGIIVLNGQKLDQGYLALGTNTGSNAAHNNSQKLFAAVSRSANFVARREEQLSTTHYFCRVTNKKYNFSTNPTFFTQSDGSLTVSSMQNDPKVYVTTVGLYNDNNELLAVAKLSKPLLKSFSREAIIKVKLDF
jgi:hypothetical protein|tara:strand:+ start:1746 stop:2774 length:1029 start_codon:yes stop_codon:yes gene_type:complete